MYAYFEALCNEKPEENYFSCNVETMLQLEELCCNSAYYNRCVFAVVKYNY